ncbi:hypothetical protein QY049_02860 [Bradyrhizobium sp. WYCCWR 13022]|uniref:hypothetical protein n=1 Tax=unclassified Bradyrhizobium TaxID=2631580 RepID=UPI00263BAA50|nr:hypothetical protein [Bradyrhizobium sp. WYCCWR 13022]MDN4982164.1 hypothetical protein [Bradyrhizobium sp. WYCCWR 13022]
MREPKTKAAKARKKRTDGRSQILIYMDPSVIGRLKLAALAMKKPAFVLAEKAIEEWLKNHQAEIKQGTAKISRGE